MSLDVDQAFAKDVFEVWVLLCGVSGLERSRCARATLSIRTTKVCNADKTDIGFPNFADAAFPRMRSAAYFATQRISPERPFMNGIDFSFRTVALSQRSFLFSATTFGSGLSLSLSVQLLLLRD